jgi:hypothetical protein
LSVNKSRSEIGEQYNICQKAVIGPDVKIGMNSPEFENVFHTINNSFFWNPILQTGIEIRRTAGSGPCEMHFALRCTKFHWINLHSWHTASKFGGRRWEERFTVFKFGPAKKTAADPFNTLFTHLSSRLFWVKRREPKLSGLVLTYLKLRKICLGCRFYFYVVFHYETK